MARFTVAEPTASISGHPDIPTKIRRLARVIDVSGTLVCHLEKPGVRLFPRDRARLRLDSQPAGFLPASVLTSPPTSVCLSAYDRPDDAHTSACTRVHTRAYSLLSFFNYSVLFTGIKITGRVVRPTIGQSHVVLASRYVQTRKGLFPPTFLRLSRSI